MRAPPEIFDPGKTHCPSCNATLDSLVERCGFCGFTAQTCVQRYPFVPPPLDRFVDPDSALEPGERKVLNKALNRFEKRFPQVTVTVCVMQLPEGTDGREFGYWYLNRSLPRNPEERKRRQHHMLVIVDRSSHSVSVTVGYGLDCILDDVFLPRSLNEAEHHFKTRGYVEGIAQWLKLLTRNLGTALDEAQFAQERWERRGSPMLGQFPQGEALPTRPREIVQSPRDTEREEPAPKPNPTSISGRTAVASKR